MRKSMLILKDEKQTLCSRKTTLMRAQLYAPKGKLYITYEGAATSASWTPRNRGRKVEFTIVPHADKSRAGMKLSRQMRTILMRLEEKDGKGKRKRFVDGVKDGSVLRSVNVQYLPRRTFGFH
eukprot:g7251.t1